MNDVIMLFDRARNIRKTILQVAHHVPSDGVHISSDVSIFDILTINYGSVLRYDASI